MGSRFISPSLAMNLTLLLLTVIPQITSDNYLTECQYPCLPPPIEPTTDYCPPPPEALPPPPPPPQPPSETFMQPPPIFQTPPSEIYPPPTDTGYIPYFPPPSWFGNSVNSPPPPDPILPYFPWYYRQQPLSGQQSSLASTNLMGTWFLVHVIVFMTFAAIL